MSRKRPIDDRLGASPPQYDALAESSGPAGPGEIVDRREISILRSGRREGLALPRPRAIVARLREPFGRPAPFRKAPCCAARMSSAARSAKWPGFAPLKILSTYEVV